MVCFLRLLSRTITPNRRRGAAVVRAFSSEGDAHNGATDTQSDEFEDVQSKLATGAGWGDLAMKWFLQFLSIGSVVLYALLIIIDERIPDSAVENTLVSEAQPKQRRLSVWDSHLPYRSFGQDRQASLSPEPIRQENETLASKPYRQSPRQYFDHQPASDVKLTASEIDDGKQTGVLAYRRLI